MGIQPSTSVIVQRVLRVLDEILLGEGRVEAAAEKLELPVSTAYRQVATLVGEGCLMRVAGGRYVAGPRLLGLMAQVDARQIVATAAEPALERLARNLRATVQLGTLDSAMVTYRVKAGRSAAALFTQVGMQMEAYCSAVGKVLLAHLPTDELDAYLDNGPFVALTAATITDPQRLREELGRVREQGFAFDIAEAAEGLYCVARPLRTPDGAVRAAVSVSRSTETASRQGNDRVLAELAGALHRVEDSLRVAGGVAAPQGGSA